MGSITDTMIPNILRELYGECYPWHGKVGAREELIKRIEALTKFEAVMAGLDE